MFVFSYRCKAWETVWYIVDPNNDGAYLYPIQLFWFQDGGSYQMIQTGTCGYVHQMCHLLEDKVSNMLSNDI